MILFAMLSFISCGSNSHETTGVMSLTNECFEISKKDVAVADHAMAQTVRTAIINADCNYYLRYGDDPVGRFMKGQEIIIAGYYYLDGRFDVFVEVMTVDATVSGYISEQYITVINGVAFNVWWQNNLLTREYYYTGTVEEIFNNDYGNTIAYNTMDRENLIHMWKANYTEDRLYIFNNYLAFGNDDDGAVYRLESIAREKNTYTLHLSEYPRGEFEITLVVDSDGITITHYVVKKELLVDRIPNLLNFKYVPYDINKSEKTKASVLEWCDEQLKILTQNKQHTRE